MKIITGLCVAGVLVAGGAAHAQKPPAGGGSSGAAEAAANGQYSMTIRNTNQTMSIERLWVANAGTQSAQWTEVTMQHPIQPGTDSTFTIPATTGRCFYNVRMRFSDGGDASTPNVNVCRHDVLSAH